VFISNEGVLPLHNTNKKIPFHLPGLFCGISKRKHLFSENIRGANPESYSVVITPRLNMCQAVWGRVKTRSFYRQFKPSRQATTTDLNPTDLKPETEFGINYQCGYWNTTALQNLFLFAFSIKKQNPNFEIRS